MVMWWPLDRVCGISLFGSSGSQSCHTAEPETQKNNNPEAEDLGQTKQSVLTNVHAALICS